MRKISRVQILVSRVASNFVRDGWALAGGALSQLRKNPYFFRGSFADWALSYSTKSLPSVFEALVKPQNPVASDGDCHNKHPSSICSIALIYLCPAVARTNPLPS